MEKIQFVCPHCGSTIGEVGELSCSVCDEDLTKDWADMLAAQLEGTAVFVEEDIKLSLSTLETIDISNSEKMKLVEENIKQDKQFLAEFEKCLQFIEPVDTRYSNFESVHNSLQSRLRKVEEEFALLPLSSIKERISEAKNDIYGLTRIINASDRQRKESRLEAEIKKTLELLSSLKIPIAQGDENTKALLEREKIRLSKDAEWLLAELNRKRNEAKILSIKRLMTKIEAVIKDLKSAKDENSRKAAAGKAKQNIEEAKELIEGLNDENIKNEYLPKLNKYRKQIKQALRGDFSKDGKKRRALTPVGRWIFFIGSKKGVAASVFASIFETILLFGVACEIIKGVTDDWLLVSSVISPLIFGAAMLLNFFVVAVPFSWFFKNGDPRAARRRVIGIFYQIVAVVCILLFFALPVGKAAAKPFNRMMYNHFKKTQNYAGAVYMLNEMGYNIDSSKAVQKYTTMLLKNAKKGDKVYLSSKKFNNSDDYFTSKAWIVLEKSKNKVLLLSPWYDWNYYSFSSTNAGIWNKSNAHIEVTKRLTKSYTSKYLNKAMMTTNVTTGDAVTNDKLFLISKSQWKKYKNSSTLFSKPFILRDGKKNSTYFAFLNMSFEDFVFHDYSDGMRFAVWIDLSKL